MSHALHQHGRNITEWLPTVTARQGIDCGELVSAFPNEVAPPEDKGELSRAEIGIGLRLLVLVIFVGAIAGGGTGNG